jgi:hypothetical protein
MCGLIVYKARWRWECFHFDPMAGRNNNCFIGISCRFFKHRCFYGTFLWLFISKILVSSWMLFRSICVNLSWCWRFGKPCHLLLDKIVNPLSSWSWPSMMLSLSSLHYYYSKAKQKTYISDFFRSAGLFIQTFFQSLQAPGCNQWYMVGRSSKQLACKNMDIIGIAFWRQGTFCFE